MAIVRMGDADGLGDRGGSSELSRAESATPAKKAAKKALTKHAAKKHAGKGPGKKAAKKAPGKVATKSSAKEAKKAAAKFARNDRMLHGVEQAEAGGTFGDLRDGEHQAQMARAFHHLQRAGAVISLLERDSGGDLKMLLEHGIDLYKRASGTKRKENSVTCAFGLLRAAEHLGMAGLYSSRSDYRVEVAPPPRHEVAQHLAELAPRLDLLSPPERENGRRLEAMARELLRRAEGASHDPHMEYELTKAADGICTALEEGL